MIGRRRGPRAAVGWASAFALAVGGGCGVMNPALVGSLSGNPAGALTQNKGHIVLLLMNQSIITVGTRFIITNENGSTSTITINAGPLNFFPFVLSCDAVEVTVDAFISAGVGGSVETPANRGTLIQGQGFGCGDVIAVRAAGAPPAFDVGVF